MAAVAGAGNRGAAADAFINNDQVRWLGPCPAHALAIGSLDFKQKYGSCRHAGIGPEVAGQGAV